MILSFLSNHWRKFIFPLVAVMAILAFLFVPREQVSQETVLLSEKIPLQEKVVEEVPQDEQLENTPVVLIVDVRGAVVHPGVYTLEENDRLIDAINAAGGYVPEADTRLINHALKLLDEMLIYIPVNGEEPVAEMAAVQEVVSSPTNDSDGKVNLNTATETELTTLSGIGPAKAAAIIQYREEQGPFQKPEDLMEISGIGQKTFEKLESTIIVK